ncbi:hypothetical protein QT970_00945, partial [Microcoleus sp. herbarium8]
MAYSDFKLNEVSQRFGLTVNEASGMFADVPEAECSDLLVTILGENVDLAVAINTEKARSEMIISLVLLEIRRKFKGQISLFSGVDFTVDVQQGLNGFCDFIIRPLAKITRTGSSAHPTRVIFSCGIDR